MIAFENQVQELVVIEIGAQASDGGAGGEGCGDAVEQHDGHVRAGLAYVPPDHRGGERRRVALDEVEEAGHQKTMKREAFDTRAAMPSRAMGMTGRQILWQVELPLALGVILAGVRVATVITVGVATIAAAIGAGGLGMYIFRGVAMVDNQVILAGAIPAAVLAVAADGGLGWIERRLRAN